MKPRQVVQYWLLKALRVDRQRSWAHGQMAAVTAANVALEPLPDPSCERAVLKLLDGLVEYAEAFDHYCHRPVAQDSALGPHWCAIAEALRCLLDGGLGRLDGATIDAILTGLLRQQGIDLDMER